MAEMEAYVLQRQREILEGRAVDQARGAPYAALCAALFAVVLFAMGRYFFGIWALVLAVISVTPPIFRWWRQRYSRPVSPRESGLKAMPPEMPLPSPEALFARASEQDRLLLDLPIPRHVPITPRRRDFLMFLLPIAFCVLFLWLAFDQVEPNGHLQPSTPNAAMMIIAAGFSAAILYSQIHSLRKERHLLARGQTTLGLVIIKTEEGAGKRKWTQVWYDFRDATGRIHTEAGRGSRRRYKEYPSAGHVIAVFYDPANPKRQTSNCTSPYKIAPLGLDPTGSHS